jgi:transposase
MRARRSRVASATSSLIRYRDGVALVLDCRTRRLFPFIERIYGDGGYQGPKAARAAARTGGWTIEVVGRSPAAVGFEVLPKRWIVERTFAWLSRFRRLARDFECYARTVVAFVRLAMIRIMLKRLVANPSS